MEVCVFMLYPRLIQTNTVALVYYTRVFEYYNITVYLPVFSYFRIFNILI